MDDIKQFFSQTINMIYALIALNAILFLSGIEMPLKSENIHIADIFGAIFTHFDFGHLFFNMFGLYIFGTLLVRALKPWQFLLLYLISGVVGNLIFMLFFRSENYILMGASGAVYGIMVAAAMVEPDRRFMLIILPFMPLKTKTLVVVYTVIEILSQMSGSVSTTAHLAHLGGIVGGYLFVEIFARKAIAWEPLFFLRRKHPAPTVVPPKQPQVFTFNSPFPVPVSQKELDYLLDKVSQGGINSLTPEELVRLRQAREQIIYTQKMQQQNKEDK